MTPPSRTLAETIRDLAPIGTALTDAAARLAYMRRLMPQGPCELTEEFKELETTLAWIERTYRDADERLLDAYRLLEHAERVPNPQPLSASVQA